MILPITLTIAGAAALIAVWLGLRAGRVRLAEKVGYGDGGREALLVKMRAQANFVEYAPFFLILLGLVEMATGSEIWLWLVGILFIVARIVHVFGMDRPPPNRLRAAGIILTVAALIGLALTAIAIPYLERPRVPEMIYAQGAKGPPVIPAPSTTHGSEQSPSGRRSCASAAC